MPDYAATFTYVDALNGTTQKTFYGTFTDDAAATFSFGALKTDLENATSAHIQKGSLSKLFDYAGAPNGGSRVFERVSATVETVDGDKANVQLPAPIDAMMTGNALNTASTQWVNFVNNIASGGEGWTISDGEQVTATIAGKRVFVRSGSTNLP